MPHASTSICLPPSLPALLSPSPCSTLPLSLLYSPPLPALLSPSPCSTLPLSLLYSPPLPALLSPSLSPSLCSALSLSLLCSLPLSALLYSPSLLCKTSKRSLSGMKFEEQKREMTEWGVDNIKKSGAQLLHFSLHKRRHQIHKHLLQQLLSLLYSHKCIRLDNLIISNLLPPSSSVLPTPLLSSMHSSNNTIT